MEIASSLEKCPAISRLSACRTSSGPLGHQPNRRASWMAMNRSGLPAGNRKNPQAHRCSGSPEAS